MGKVAVVALVVALIVGFACDAWQSSYVADQNSTGFENVQRAIDDSGAPASLRRDPIAAPQAPLPAQHPVLSAILAFIIVLVVGRVAQWGQTVEAGAKTLRERRQ